MNHKRHKVTIFLIFSAISALVKTPLVLLSEDLNTEVFSKSPKRKDMFGGVRSPLGRINENKIETEWEKSPENNVSPLKFNSSTDTFRLKENVNNQLKDQFSNKKLKKEITDSENSKINAKNVGFCPSISGGGHGQGVGGDDMKKCPRGRSPVVSARRVISTRITHGAPDNLTAYEGDNPNAGNYMSRMRTRTVR